MLTSDLVLSAVNWLACLLLFACLASFTACARLERADESFFACISEPAGDCRDARKASASFAALVDISLVDQSAGRSAGPALTSDWINA